MVGERRRNNPQERRRRRRIPRIKIRIRKLLPNLKAQGGRNLRTSSSSFDLDPRLARGGSSSSSSSRNERVGWSYETTSRQFQFHIHNPSFPIYRGVKLRIDLSFLKSDPIYRSPARHCTFPPSTATLAEETARLGAYPYHSLVIGKYLVELILLP